MSSSRYVALPVSLLVACMPLIVNPQLFSACPQNRPHNEGCSQPTTATACANGSVPCEDRFEQDRWNGDFGCEDNGKNMTQCLNGTAQQQVICYEECACTYDELLGTCVWDDPCGFHWVIPKVISDCQQG